MSERRFKPTRKRLREARREGKTPKSQLFTAAVGSFCVILSMVISARFYWVENQILLEYLWFNTAESPVAALKASLQCIWKVLVPCVVIAGVVAVGAQVLQVGLVWEFSALAPRLDRLSPGTGSARVAGGLRQLGWVSVRLAALTIPVFWLVGGRLLPILQHPFSPFEIGSAFTSIEWMLAALIVLGALDWGASARRYRESVYMTLDEMRREHRENEGDPQIKSYRRSQHAALSREELVRRVRRAKVIVVERAAAGQSGEGASKQGV